jgi:capsular polysaccharide biosynthesis protein
MVTVDSGPPSGGRERLLLERVARAERLLAAQRVLVRKLENGGFDITQPRALLQLMEAVTEQFRTTCRLFRTYRPPPPIRREVSRAPPAPSTERSWTRPAAAEAPPAIRATDLATFPCRHCGMALAVARESDGALVYQLAQWRRRCRYQTLQAPALCQLIPKSADAVQ